MNNTLRVKRVLPLSTSNRVSIAIGRRSISLPRRPSRDGKEIFLSAVFAACPTAKSEFARSLRTRVWTGRIPWRSNFPSGFSCREASARLGVWCRRDRPRRASEREDVETRRASRVRKKLRNGEQRSRLAHQFNALARTYELWRRVFKFQFAALNSGQAKRLARELNASSQKRADEVEGRFRKPLLETEIHVVRGTRPSQ